MTQSLDRVCGIKNDAMFTRPSLSLYIDTSKFSNKKKSFGSLFKKKKAKGGVNTLLNTGTRKDKKNNEYFGGDSTVTMAGEEDEEE
jgi:hypothetical protein